MKIDFRDSKTKINLLKAFAGESQARNRYTFAASFAKNEGLQVIEKLFLFTADQEKEHAKIFYKLLAPFAGENIKIDNADYPVDMFSKSLEFLKKAKFNEYEEYHVIYKSFSEVAAQEEFYEISQVFLKIAEIEKIHGDRFEKFSKLLEAEELFSSRIKSGWICLNCGNIYKGFEAPKTCPVCDHPGGFYLKNENFIFV
jgi:rubrerythrin